MSTTSTRAQLAEPSDLAFAEYCLRALEKEFMYTTTHKWMWYNGKIWIPDWGHSLNKRVGQLLRNLCNELSERGWNSGSRMCLPNRAKVMQVVAWLADYLRAPQDIEGFDASLDHLNVANGVVDLRTGEVAKHHHSQHFTYALDVPYHPKASQAAWLKFLRGVIDETSIPLLQVAVGYSLTGRTWEEKLFYIHGPTRAGKGVFSETLLALFTPALSCEVEFNTFTRDRDHDANNFDLAPLKPARLLFASESGRTTSLNDAKVKALTGGNQVRCAFKFGTHFVYKPQFKIWLVSNYDINADPNDDAVWNRIVRFAFPQTFVGREDKALKARLQQPEMLEGVLAWAVEGAKRWYVEGLPLTDELRQDVRDVREELDVIQAWLDECTQDVRATYPMAFVSNGALHTSYEIWCKRHGLKTLSTIGLSRILVTKGFDQARNSRQRGFLGLVLPEEAGL